MSDDSVVNFEERIGELKNTRDSLMNKKAEFLARRDAAKEELEKLEKKANEKGFSLKDLPSLTKKKKKALEEQCEELETVLDRASDELSKYKEKE